MFWEALGRWSVYAAALGVFGVLGARWLLGRQAARARGSEALQRRLAILGSLAACALLVAVSLRVLCQSAAVFGAEQAAGAESLRVVVFESRWGGRWQPQLFAAMLTAFGASLTFSLRRLGVVISTCGVLALAVALPATGHAFGRPAVWAVQSVHVVGMGSWMGTLLLVLLVTRGAPRVRHAALVELAPLAFGAVALVAGSGAYLAIRALPEVAALWQSRWGQLLVAKVLLVLGALALGARNHRALRASPATGSGLPWLRSVLGEALVGLAIVTVTAFLTSVSQPDHALDLEVAPVEAAPEDGTVHPEEDGHDH